MKRLILVSTNRHRYWHLGGFIENANQFNIFYSAKILAESVERVPLIVVVGKNYKKFKIDTPEKAEFFFNNYATI